MEVNEVVDNIFKELVKQKGFNISYSKLYMYLNKSNFIEKIEELEEKKTMTLYKLFINEQLDNGVNLKEVIELWEKTKKNKKEYNKYEEKFKLYKERNLNY